MTFADANRAQIRTLEEVTWGITPTVGSSREMRLTSSSLSATKETAVSDELRADRMVPDIVEVAAHSSGEINFEWSSGPQDEFLAGFLLSTWTRPMNMDFWKGSIVTVSAANTFTLVGVDATPYIEAGRVIKIVGLEAAANNGYFTVATVAVNGSNTDITVAASNLVVEAGGNAARLYDANDVIINGNETISATASGFAGTGVFASAIAAGQLQVGQQVTVEGMGYGTAVVTFTTAAASTFAMVLSDGTNELTITTTTDFDPGVDHIASAAALAAFINTNARTGATALNVKASDDGAGVVTVTNLNTFVTDPVTLVRTASTGGGQAYVTVPDANVVVTSFSAATITVAGDITTSVLTLDNGNDTITALTAGTSYPVTGAGAAADGAALAAAINALEGWTAVDDSAGILTVYPKHANATINVTTVDATVVLTTPVEYTGSTESRGVFRITGVADDLLSVTPAPQITPAGQAVVIKGSHLRNSGNVNAIAQRSWSIETAYTDIDQYMEQDGMVVGTMGLEIASGSILTGTLGFEGRATSLRQSTLLGSPLYVQQVAQSGEVSNATTDVGNIEKDGELLPACIQSLSISGEAGLRMQNCVGSKFPRGIGTGRFNLSGSATIYFENQTLFNDFISHSTLSLGWSVADAENIAYYFRIPAAKFSADEIAPGGIDQDVFENIEWTAFRDAATNTMLMLDRFSNDTAV